MPTKRLSRRTVLRGALATGAAVSVPLPILDIMLNGNGTAFAAGSAASQAVLHLVLRQRDHSGALEPVGHRDADRPGR